MVTCSRHVFAQGMYGGLFPSLEAAAMHRQMSELGKLGLLGGMGAAEAARAALGREQEERPTSSGGSRGSGARKADSLAALKAAARSHAKGGDGKEGDAPKDDRGLEYGDHHLARRAEDEGGPRPHSPSPRCVPSCPWTPGCHLRSYCPTCSTCWISGEG